MKTIATSQVMTSPTKKWLGLSKGSERTSFLVPNKEALLKKNRIEQMLHIVTSLHQDAVDHEVNQLTMDDINTEIAAMRHQKKKQNQ